MDPTDDRRHLDAIADADLFPYWYDVDEPDSNPTLIRDESCDLCIVGGGYTGLWTAVIAKEHDRARDVLLIDAAEVGSAASGRTGVIDVATTSHAPSYLDELHNGTLPAAPPRPGRPLARRRPMRG